MAAKTMKIGLSAADKAAMSASIESNTNELLLDVYNSSNTYNKGDFVIYRSSSSNPYVLYRCKENSVTGTWNSAERFS